MKWLRRRYFLFFSVTILFIFISNQAFADSGYHTVKNAEALNNKYPAWAKIEPNRTSLSFKVIADQSNSTSKSFTIKNSGEGTLNYSISNDATWLSVSPQTGCSKGITIDHEASVDISGMSEGKYTATITISASEASNNPQTIAVSLKINPPPQKATIPNVPSEVSKGKNNTSYTLTRGGSPCWEDDDVEYRFDWDDGIYSSWSSSVSAGIAKSSVTSPALMLLLVLMIKEEKANRHT